MTRKAIGIASLMVVAALVVVGLAAASMLPEAARLPIHWGADGKPDGFASKWSALLLPAAMTAGVSLLFWFLPALEPRRQGLARSQGLYLWAWVAVLGLGPVIELATLSEAFGWGLSVPHVTAGAVGAMFALIGNQLGKSRSMYMVGIRTPWTLANEEVWIRTHRLGGKLMVAAGLVILAAAILQVPAEWLAPITIAAVAIAVGVPVVYSYLLWRGRRGDQSSA